MSKGVLHDQAIFFKPKLEKFFLLEVSIFLFVSALCFEWVCSFRKRLSYIFPCTNQGPISQNRSVDTVTQRSQIATALCFTKYVVFLLNLTVYLLMNI